MSAHGHDAVLALLRAANEVDDALLAGLLSLARDQRRRDVVWLTLALLHPLLPVQVDVERAFRRLRLDGPKAVLDDERVRRSRSPISPEPPPLHERLVLGGVVLDVHSTAHHPYRTGIQRVVIESGRRWAAAHPLRAVAWTQGWGGLRDLDAAEHDRVLARPGREQQAQALVPWGCTYVLPEIAGDLLRAQRLASMVESGAVRLSLIAYDLIPITGAETAAPGMPSAFASYLGVVRHATSVAAISEAATTEFRGFCDMLAGQGVTGPDVREVCLAAEAVAVDAAGVESARAQLAVGDAPFVLAVGTHEPRKNHLALLHAAELLWREGLHFSLVLLGHNGWGSDAFLALAGELRSAGRPLSLITAASDELLWGSYHAARVVAFPSLHEGFGLPVAEALACGTPVVTSDVGSMRELARGGGALAIDPHDDHALVAALRALLTDDALHGRLVAEARSRPVRTWDDYAAEVWQVLVGPGA